MSTKKPVRTKGKLPLSKYFQELENGDSVAVVIDGSQRVSFPERLQGRSGKVIGKKGSAYILKIKDQAKEKEYLIQPIHLKKLLQIKK
jgi:large subunit ribosomal protein L21e